MAEVSFLSFVLPMAAASNAFSGIFGGSGHDEYSMAGLLNLQMEMLENMSAKIDVIQKGIEFIIDNQDKIAKLIEDVPSETVAELYRSDLQGAFILVREKIEAYAISRARNKAEANKVFQPVFDQILSEIQISRARIFRIDKYLDLPVVSTCLHFEIFCMILSGQPGAVIETTLKAYTRWIRNCLDGALSAKLFERRKTLAEKIAASKILYTYTKCLQDSGTKAGGEGTKDYPTYTIYVYTLKFDKFGYDLQTVLSWEQKAELQFLLDRKLIESSEIPSKLVVGSPPVTFIYETESFGNQKADWQKKVLKFKISEDFTVLESDYAIANETMSCALATPDINPPPFKAEAALMSTEITDCGYEVVLYASLVNIANESLLAIGKLFAAPENLGKDSILSFGQELEEVSRIYNDRADQWIRFIDERIEQVEDRARKEKIKELRDEMAELKSKEGSILLDYKALEEKLAQNMPGDLLSAVSRLLEPMGRELERGVQNLGKEAKLLAQNVGRNLEKASQDIGKQLERDIQNTGDLFVAVEGYLENQIKAWGDIVTDAERRVMEGKIVDALWHIGTDQIKHTEENAFTALQQSSLLNSIAASVVTIYGAPYGGAIYAAWFTYKQTGSLDLALKVAVITYLTSEGMGQAKQITDVAKRTLVTSAVAATAIAASGGTEKDIIDGFLKGAALSIASEAYRNMTSAEIEGKAPTQAPLDKQELLKDKRLVFLNKKGEEVLDITKLSREATHVGLDSGTGIFSEKGYPLQLFAKVPYVNDMAYFHDQWCAVEGFGITPTVVTIIPATILTVAGSERPVLDEIIEVINGNK